MGRKPTNRIYRIPNDLHGLVMQIKRLHQTPSGREKLREVANMLNTELPKERSAQGTKAGLSEAMALAEEILRVGKRELGDTA